MTQTTTAATSFSVLPYLERRFERAGRSLGLDAAAPRDASALRQWQARLADRLRELTGYATMQRAPLDARITETVQCDGYQRQRVEMQTEPGVVMPLYVLVPDGAGADDPRPAVMCPHGHGSGGKLSPAGVDDDPLITEAIERCNYDYGVQYARAGVVAFCPDARGFGERQEPSLHLAGQAPITTSSCQMINQMAYPLGQTVTGMWAWDLHRLLDYIQTRPDCQPGRIGCAGLSGGGLQTLWASALDDRIQAAVVSGYFYGYRQSLLQMHWNCSCNYVPHLYETADMGEIAALIAPRPLLIETGTRDPLNGASGVENVTTQVAVTRRAYELCDAGDRLVHDIFEGDHRWHGKTAVPWLVERLAL